MTPDYTVAWMRAQYERSKAYQEGKGIRFELPFNEYFFLWSPYRLRKLSKLIAAGEIDSYQRNPKFAWVLSWKSKEARQGGVMNKDTARILLRMESERRFHIQKGEKQSEAAKAKIGHAHRGKTISGTHRRAISKARKGRKQSQEQIAKRVATTKATKARKALAAAQPCSIPNAPTDGVPVPSFLSQHGNSAGNALL